MSRFTVPFLVALPSRAVVALPSCLAVALLSCPAALAGERVSELLRRDAGLEKAVAVGEGIFLASANSNAYLVVTPEGSVLIDTGLGVQAERQKQVLEAVSDVPLRAIVLTHAHPDHIGGAPLWAEAGAPIVAQRHFRWRNLDHARLAAFRNARAKVLWADVMPEASPPYPVIEPDVVVDDSHSFEVGGLRFEVLWTPGGEGPDGLSVWIPERRAVFVGDALGPTSATFPNLFTLRGENLREAVPMMESIDRVLALEPELLLPGHFEPLRGRERIREVLTRTRDAIAHVHDATVAGMNEGTHLFELMRTVELPPELAVSQQYGRVPWGVRAVWEGYTGWFRYDSTTELYEVPPSSVYAELAELAGGADAVAARSRARTAAGRPLEALHLAEVALAADPRGRAGLEARLAALEALAAEVGDRNFQEAGWLRHRIAQTRQQLVDAGQDTAR